MCARYVLGDPHGFEVGFIATLIFFSIRLPHMPVPSSRFLRAVRSFLLSTSLLLAAFAGLALPNAHAQNATADSSEQDTSEQSDIYRVETREGTVYIGTLVRENDEAVVIATNDGAEVRVLRDDIRDFARVDPRRIRNGVYWFENPHATRYFFAPTGIGLRGGRGYYQNTWVFFNNVNVGVTDRFSVGAGVVPTFLFGGGAFPAWVLPKFSFSSPSGTAHLTVGGALGGIVGGGFDSDDGTTFGIFYTAGTLGGYDDNLTVGVGYGYADGALNNRPVINVSGMTRVSRRFYLVSENYFFSGDDSNGVASFGLRYAPENFAVDFGLVAPLIDDSDAFFALPWLGVTLPF